MSREATASDATYSVTVAGSADGGDRVPDLSPREALERWLSKLRVSKSESTVSSYQYRLKHFVEWCEGEGIAEIGALSGWDIESYETSRRNAGLTPLSLNKEMGTLQNFLDYCARVELVPESLPEKVDPPDVPRDAHVDEKRLRHDRAEALLDYYRDHDDRRVRHSRAHAVLSLAWFTGARLGGLRGLDVDGYNSEEQYVEFYHRPEEDTPLKNGRDGERVVGVPERVTDVLDGYVARERHEKHDDYGRRPLLTSERGRPSVNAVRAWMYRATFPCLHGPCPHGEDPEECEYRTYSACSKCPSSRSPHQVRTGSITWQLNKGVPPQVVAKRVNTSVRVIKRHYDQPDRFEEMEERRREYLSDLKFGDGGGAE